MQPTSSPSPSPTTDRPAWSAERFVPPVEIDRSCRLPVLWMFASGAVWLVIASIFGLMASIKFHAPDLLARCPWLTYGRVYPAYLNALVYGFCAQAGLGVALWILARLGHTRLVNPPLITLGVILWNLGVTLGIGGILAGHSTGFEWSEMPRYSAPFVFIGYLFIGISGLFTFSRRRERALYVSQWFLFAALFWFPWIYTTGQLLLVYLPVRGVVQEVVNWWYAHNLTWVWLGFIGMGAIFYLLPKMLARPLHSHFLAMFVFWTFALFASWGGIPAGAPMPAWIPSVSAVFTILTIVPILAVGLNSYDTLAGQASKWNEELPLRFVLFGLGIFLLAGVLQVIAAPRGINQFLQFTYFRPALTQLGVYGFFSMTVFGAIYYLVPLLWQKPWPSRKLVRAHFWCAAIGIGLYVLPLAVGGIAQGSALHDPAIPFMSVVKNSLHALRISTVGDLLLAVGHLSLLANLGWLLSDCCRGALASGRAGALNPQTVGATK